MPKLRQLSDYYVKAGKIDALAKSIRGVRDQNLWNRYGYELANLFNRLPRDHKHAPQVTKLFVATRDMNLRNQSHFASQFNQYLRGLPQDAKKLDLYRQVVLPIKQSPGEVAAFGQTFADLAKTLDRVAESEVACRKAMQQFPQFKAKGELLVAMLGLRKQNEQLMTALAEKYRKNSSFAAELNSEKHVLRIELAKCKGGAAVELALELFRKQAATEQGQSTYATQQVATLLVKRGDRKAARQMLLDALKRPMSGNYGNNEEYLERMKVQRRQSLARELAKHGFRRDAVAVYAKACAVDTTKLKSNSYVFSQIRQAQNAGRQLIQQIIAGDIDKTLSELEKTISNTEETPNLTSFLTVFDEVSAGENSQRKPSGADSILPAVLAHAKKTNRLSALQGVVKEALVRHAGHQQLTALHIMCTLAADGTGRATDDLKQLVSRVNKSPQRIDDSIWLVGRAAMKPEETREQGRKLAEAVARHAGKTANRPRQEAAVLALTVALTKDGQADKASELMRASLCVFGLRARSKSRLIRLIRLRSLLMASSICSSYTLSLKKNFGKLALSVFSCFRNFERIFFLFSASSSTRNSPQVFSMRSWVLRDRSNSVGRAWK